MNTKSTLIAGIHKVMQNEVLCFDDIEEHVNFEDAMHWLRTEGAATNNPAQFLEQFWGFIHKTSYAYDMSDYYPGNHIVWSGDFMSAAKHVLSWDLINSSSSFMEDEGDNERAKSDFTQWIDDLVTIPVRWRPGVCKVVAVLYNEDGGMSKDGNFDMGSPSDTVIATLDEPYRTMLRLTGDYTLGELQNIVESTLVKHASCELPEVDLTDTGPA